MNLRIEKYNKQKHFDLWDDFVLNRSCNGTIFHTQLFLSYHSNNKFIDSSILLYDENKLIAVILVAQLEEDYFSHPGTSGGGLVISQNYYKAEKLNLILDEVIKHFDNKLNLRVFESYFSEVNNDLLVYFLNKKGHLYSELSIYLKILKDVDLISTISDQKTRTAVRKLEKQNFNFSISNEQNDFKKFHDLITENLRKHNIKPVHSLEEILRINDMFPDKQFLALGKDETGKTVCAMWVFKASSSTWHPQYIAKDYNSKLRCTIEKTIIEVMSIARKEHVKRVSLGISTENMGEVLNFGLTSFKEIMGGYHQFRYIFKSEN